MSELNLKYLTLGEQGFDQNLADMLSWESVSDGDMQKLVADIIHRVRKEGDARVNGVFGKV